MNYTNKVLGCIVFLIHYLIFYIFPVYLSVFSTNKTVLLITIFYWMTVIFNWYLFDSCFLTIIEHKLLYGEYKQNKWSNWYIILVKKYFGHILGNMLMLIIIGSPLFFSLFAMYNIHNYSCIN